MVKKSSGDIIKEIGKFIHTNTDLKGKVILETRIRIYDEDEYHNFEKAYTCKK